MSTDFAALHRPGVPLFLPNAWDFASAAALVGAGYPAIGTTSLGVAAAAGKPDATGDTRDDTIALAVLLGKLPTMLTVDIEAGFADDPAEVADLVSELAAAGAVGVNLEDGRPDGTLTATEAHCAKIAAIKALVPDVFVNARTDAFWLKPAGISPGPEAIARGRAFADAGADSVFVPAAADPAEIATLTEQIPRPVNILYLPGKHTVAQLAEVGVARVSTGSLLFRAALATTVQLADEVAGRSTTPGLPSYHDVQHLIVGRPD